eukprot:7673573-Pyramimonas_sp.AAC.1
MHLDFGNWEYNYLYSAELVTEQFDKPILVADGQRDIVEPLRLAGLPEERPSLRTMEVDKSTPRISVRDWMAFRNKQKDQEAPRGTDRPIPDNVPGRIEPRGQRRTMGLVRRGGR